MDNLLIMGIIVLFLVHFVEVYLNYKEIKSVKDELEVLRYALHKHKSAAKVKANNIHNTIDYNSFMLDTILNELRETFEEKSEV